MAGVVSQGTDLHGLVDQLGGCVNAAGEMQQRRSSSSLLFEMLEGFHKQNISDLPITVLVCSILSSTLEPVGGA